MENIKRIVAVLFIKDGLIVRSQNFSKHQYIGNVIEQAKRLNDYNIDELVYIDISRTENYDLGRDDLFIKSKKDILTIIGDISKVCFMPLTFGGKIRSLKDAVVRIRAGADKITINHLLFHKPDEVKKIVKNIGSQAVVASIDYKVVDGKSLVFNNFGKKNTGLDLFEFLKSVESLGVGEIFLQNINNDGSQTGFDLENIEKSVEATSLPLIACSGAGSSNHFVDVLKIKNISAVAAGNIFNYTERSYPRIKQEIKKYIKNVR
tara:strand:+ start:8140 stop:8928 length:789 start_codon:yes stop_codon:yes gene_type:complete